MDDMDYYEWEAYKNRSKLSKLIRFLLKAIVAVIIVGTFTVLLGRMAIMTVPKAFRALTLTSGIQQTIDEGTFDAIEHEPYSAFDEDGWYHFSNIALSKSAGEVQMTFRYNTRSTVNDLMAIYDLNERPNGELFVFVLYDDKGNTYENYVFATVSRPMYEFRRVIFSGVDLSDVKALYLDVHYIADVSENGKMSKSFVLYDPIYPSEPFTPENARGDSLEFSKAPVYTIKQNTGN